MVSDVIILAGGQGTRLKTVSGDIPKPLVPIANDRVFLDFLLTWLGRHQIERVILSLCYRPEVFQAYLNRRQFPFKVEIVVEPRPLDTGGAVNYVIEYMKMCESFIVLNGDTFLNFNLHNMIEKFETLESSSMVGLSYVKDTSRYGSVVFSQDKMLSFIEKTESSRPGWINNGCYLLSGRVFSSWSGKFSMERDLFPLLAQDKTLHVYKTDGTFVDIGVPEDFFRFRNMVASCE